MAFYRLSPLAALDLQEIGDYIALDNREAAVRMIASIAEKFEFLARKPKMFPLYPGYKNLRKHNVGNYLIFYRAIKGGIEVVRILHGARDLQKPLSN